MMKKRVITLFSIILLSACTTNNRTEEPSSESLDSTVEVGSSISSASSLEPVPQEESSIESVEVITEVVAESDATDEIEEHTEFATEQEIQGEQQEEYEQEGPIIDGEYKEYEYYEEETEEEIAERERTFQLAENLLSNSGFFLGGTHDYLYSKPNTSGLSQALFLATQSNDEDGFLSSKIYPVFEEASSYLTDIEIWLHDFNEEVILIAKNGEIIYSIVD